MFQDVLFRVYQRVTRYSDLNLTFHEDAFRKERINDETCFAFDGTLTYQPEECFHRHYQNEQTIIK